MGKRRKKQKTTTIIKTPKAENERIQIFGLNSAKC